MALHFLTSSEMSIDVVVTCDSAVQATEEQKAAYLQSGQLSDLGSHEGATMFTLKALSPSEREQCEVRAGAYTRSELGRHLYYEALELESVEKARWHHALGEDEREAMAGYQHYLNQVYNEMIKASLTHIDGEPATFENIDHIRPDDHRVATIVELVVHIRRISLLGDSGK